MPSKSFHNNDIIVCNTDKKKYLFCITTYLIDTSTASVSNFTSTYLLVGNNFYCNVRGLIKTLCCFHSIDM